MATGWLALLPLAEKALEYLDDKLKSKYRDKLYELQKDILEEEGKYPYWDAAKLGKLYDEIPITVQAATAEIDQARGAKS
jgi:hypothetical protein